ncbi:ankyrin repeat domain-containing protein [Roseobacter sp. EG26]|uniref:ankyrin repeat domain-containing protein n=1 Tax=Roseobacter sp. EG26 TaxID=3412477 RepID=UPI003CE4DB0A
MKAASLIFLVIAALSASPLAAQIADDPKDAILFISCDFVFSDGGRQPASAGTGFLITRSGHVVSAKHVLAPVVPDSGVVTECNGARIERKNKSFPLVEIQPSPDLDVAVAHSEEPLGEDFPHLGFCDANRLRAGTPDLWTLGFPLDADITREDFKIRNFTGPLKTWTTGGNIVKGYSGAPVMDASNWVYGFVVGGQRELPGFNNMVPENIFRQFVRPVGPVICSDDELKAAVLSDQTTNYAVITGTVTDSNFNVVLPGNEGIDVEQFVAAIVSGVSVEIAKSQVNLEPTASKIGVTEETIINFFEILGRTNVLPEERGEELIRIAVQYTELRNQWERLETPDDPDRGDLKTRAIAELESGNYALAEKLMRDFRSGRDVSKNGIPAIETDSVVSLASSRTLLQRPTVSDPDHATEELELSVVGHPSNGTFYHNGLELNDYPFIWRSTDTLEYEPELLAEIGSAAIFGVRVEDPEGAYDQNTVRIDVVTLSETVGNLKLDSIARLIYQIDPNINQVGNNGETALMAAARVGDLRLVKLLIENFGADVNVSAKSGTALTKAIEFGNFAVMRYLHAEGGADLNLPGKPTHPIALPWRPLHYAVAHNRPRFVSYLLRNDAAPRLATEEGLYDSVIGLAIDQGDDKVIDVLLEEDDFMLDSPYAFGRTPVGDAIHSRQYGILRKLIQKGGASPNTKTEGFRPLDFAIRGVVSSDVEAVKILLEEGADPGLPSDDGLTPLFVVLGESNRIIENRAKLLELLIDFQANFNERSKTGYTPLTRAFDYVSSEPSENDIFLSPHHIRRMIIDGKANVSERTDAGYDALLYAVLYEHWEVAEILIDNGATVGAVNSFPGYNALQTALVDPGDVTAEKREVIRRLTNVTSNPDAIDEFGNTALMLAAKRQKGEIIDMLLAIGSNQSLQNKLYDETALHIAISSGNLEAVKSLLYSSYSQPNLTAKTDDGHTPLQLAKETVDKQRASPGSHNDILSLIQENLQ